MKNRAGAQCVGAREGGSVFFGGERGGTTPVLGKRAAPAPVTLLQPPRSRCGSFGHPAGTAPSPAYVTFSQPPRSMGLAAGASGGVRLEPDISQTFHKHFTNISRMALTDTPCLEPTAKQSSRPCPGCLRLGPPTKSLGRHSVHVIRGRRHRRSHLFCVNLSDGVKRIPTAAAVAVAIDPCRVDHITLL